MKAENREWLDVKEKLPDKTGTYEIKIIGRRPEKETGMVRTEYLTTTAYFQTNGSGKHTWTVETDLTDYAILGWRPVSDTSQFIPQLGKNTGDKHAEFLLLLFGESGCGKTTAANVCSEKYGWRSLSSYTDRPKRYETETGHRFLTKEEYDRIPDEYKAAKTVFDGHRYCTTWKQMREAEIYVIDPAGIQDLLAKDHADPYQTRPIMQVYLKTGMETRVSRMRKRMDSEEKIHERLVHDARAFSEEEFTFPYLTIEADYLTPEETADKLKEIADLLAAKHM